MDLDDLTDVIDTNKNRTKNKKKDKYYKKGNLKVTELPLEAN